MLENFIWKNLLLPSFVKKEVVSFYEKNTTNPYLSQTNISIKKSLIYYMCNIVHKKWFIETQKYLFNQPENYLTKDIYEYLKDKALPMSFWLFLAKTNKVEKLKKLFDWGFNVNKTFEIKGVEVNLLHQVIWAYNKNLINLNDCKEIINELIRNDIHLFFKGYKISQYEKSVAISKENENSDNILLKKKKLVELIFSWIDKDLYQYLITSELNEEDKCILEYMLLKNKIHSIYVDQYSGNMRKIGQENLYKSINFIENIIKREYVFINQSSTYNALSLIFNLPNISDLLNNNSILHCYKKYDDLKNSAKKYLLSNLVGKNNKDVIVFNLLNYSDLNWQIPTEKGRECLGLILIKENIFTDYVINSECFNLLNTSSKGENILHLIGNEINNKEIYSKLNYHIDYLSYYEIEYLLNQRDNNQLTPILRAIKDDNQSLLKFLLELNPNCIEEEAGVEQQFASPLNYLENKIGLDDESNESSYWHYLLKSWKIEKSYLSLNKKIKNKETKEKIVKI